MKRRGILPIALFAHAGALVVLLAAPDRLEAQDFRTPGRARSRAATPNSDLRMSAPTAARAGSIERENASPAYQQPLFDPPPQMSPANQTAAAASSAAPRASRRSTPVRRAAYEEIPSAGGTVMDSTSVMAPGGPEELPMPTGIESIHGMSGAPFGAMPSQFAPGQYGMGPGHSGDCGCEGGVCDGSCGSSGGCGDCGMCDSCPDWYPGKDLTLFAGVHGFKNSVDGGQNGNFGFQEGVNWSSPFWNAAGIGFQLGFQAMQSDFHESAFFANDRSQFFVTTGLFRRQMCERGWQWGVVYDFLSDEFADDFDVSQFRGELSYLFRGHELGVWFASASSDDQPGPDSASGVTAFETVDQYAFFYRRRLVHGGEGRLWAGFTGESDTIFGGDLRVPLACDWDVVAAFNYLAPQNDVTADGSFPEAWNLGINLVWYVCPEGAFKAGGSRYRPLLNVADNGSLIVNTVR